MSRSRTRAAAIAVTAAATVALGTTAAFADNSVAQQITAGIRTSSVANLTLSPVGYSHVVRNAGGTLALTADDSTGSNAGWNVTLQSSDLVWDVGTGGASSGLNIPASAFAITSAAEPVMTAGQAVDGTGGPHVPSTTPLGTLDSARKTVQAGLAFGNGTYTQVLGVNLTIPAYSAAGTYTATLTTTIVAGP